MLLVVSYFSHDVTCTLHNLCITCIGFYILSLFQIAPRLPILVSRGQTHTEGRVWSSCNGTLVLRSQHVDHCSSTTVFDDTRVVQGVNSLALIHEVLPQP